MTGVVCAGTPGWIPRPAVLTQMEDPRDEFFASTSQLASVGYERERDGSKEPPKREFLIEAWEEMEEKGSGSTVTLIQKQF